MDWNVSIFYCSSVKKLIPILVLGFLLSGCKTSNTKYDSHILILNDLREKWNNEIPNYKDLGQIKNKIWLSGNIDTTPFKYYSNQEYVKKEDKRALEKYQEYIAKDNLIIKPMLKDLSKRNELLFESYISANFSVFIDLYQGKITYGEYHLKFKEINEKYKAELSLTNNQNKNEVILNNDFTNFLILQGLINQSNQPTRIQPFTCTDLGKFINCW